MFLTISQQSISITLGRGLVFLGINGMGIVRRREGFQGYPSRPLSSFDPETVTIDPFDDAFDRLTV